MNIRSFKDKSSSLLMLSLTLLAAVLILVLGAALVEHSLPLLHQSSLHDLLTQSVWKPLKGIFGFFPFIMGTLWVTFVAVIIAFPLCLLSSIYLSEYASPTVKKLLVPFINLLSGIPPVIFGVWGVLFIVPFIQSSIAPRFVDFSTGYSVLAGGLVLAVMIFPLMTGILNQVFTTIPQELKDASAALGPTRWETIKKVILRKTSTGIIAAVALSVSRALGETIAVLMVCGNSPTVPHSLFDPGYPLPALIANNYGEMMSIPLYDSALMFAALLLFIIILLFNITSHIILSRLERKLAA